MRGVVALFFLLDCALCSGTARAEPKPAPSAVSAKPSDSTESTKPPPEAPAQKPAEEPKEVPEEEDMDDLLPYFFSPGIVWSWTSGLTVESGFGFELSAGYRPGLDLMFGGLYRFQDYDSFKRYTAGVEAGWDVLGLEAGWAWRTPATGPLVHGIHLSPYLSLGFAYFGIQLLVPVNVSAKVEVAYNLGLKLPLPHALFPLLPFLNIPGF
jgi:hypothetical protein